MQIDEKIRGKVEKAEQNTQTKKVNKQKMKKKQMYHPIEASKHVDQK